MDKSTTIKNQSVLCLMQMLQSQIEHEQTERERERQEVQERIKLLETIRFKTG
jgi:hypothetical protein